MTRVLKRKNNSPTDFENYFIELAECSNWADSRVIDWLSQITDEQWNQVAISSFGSIRNTAVHIVSDKHSRTFQINDCLTSATRYEPSKK